ncbi:GAF domain-containing protein [Natrialba aegyptia]|uniref:PAS/PAC sensor protein n=1 Tax=Natrialba aegyptia DSM 13077 TaxID=1227491 RepID=M0AXP3_9EURY|nr:GAF domain-containing protein [Natrialba aegyptia]ELZ03072.1 PAS/PAC sensor protein [Natrialba aegyptia DSM 13077]
MNDRLETPPTPEPPQWSSPETLHVLVAGSAALRQSVSETLADSALLVSTADDLTDDTTADDTVELDAARELELDSDSESQPDCLLTDDPSLSTELHADEFTIVVVSDSAGDIDVGLDTGADADTDTDTNTNTDSPVAGDSPSVEFISRETIETQSLLEHRLRRAVEFGAVQRLQSGQAEWYRSLLERSSDLLFVLDETGEITYCCPPVGDEDGPSANEPMGGHARSDDLQALPGTHFLEQIHPDDTAQVRETITAVRTAAVGASETIEYQYQTGTESDTWCIHEATLTNRLGDGLVDGIIVSARDVTEFHRVERELDESFRRVTDAFFALDSDWRFTYVNEQAAETLDVDREAILGQPILDVFPDMDGTDFQTAALEAMDQQEPRALERYYGPYDRWIETRIYPSPTGISVYFRDVTDRIERERELEIRTERLQAIVDNAPIILFTLDPDGTVTLAEGQGLNRLDTVPAEVVGRSVLDLFDDHPKVWADFRAALEGYPIHVHNEVDGRVLEAWCRPIMANRAPENGATATGDDPTVERIIGTAVDVTERVHYQETLNALHDATSHLLTVKSKQAACEYIVDVAGDVLDLDAGVYRFDDQQNELVPAAYATAFESVVDDLPRLQPGGSITWETFVSGTPAVYDDVTDADLAFDESTAVRSGLYVPLGEHGVLVAASREPGQYDDETVELAQLFARTAEAALDRIGRTSRLHDRERELKRQNTRLERLNAANRVRQDIEQLLLLSDTRSEIERGICSRLTELEACSMAWIGTPDPSGTQLRPRSQAGRDHGYLDAVTVTTVDDSAAEPAGRTARTRSPTYVENIADAVHDGDWRAEALSQTFQSVYAVPLVYGEFRYGVLALYADDRDAFDSQLRNILTELGETIAYAIDTVKHRQAAAEDDRSEVELEIERGSLLSTLATRLDATVELKGATTGTDGPLVFVSVNSTEFGTDDSEASSASVEPPSFLSEISGFVDASVIATAEGRTLFQLQLTEPFLGSIVESHGGTLRSIVATADGSTRARIDVPDAVEVRNLLSGLADNDVHASLVARRDQPADTSPSLDPASRNAILDQLTDRQREVVQTAYHGGFFEWPRHTTGEEIAASLEISPPAFHKHVRASEQKLFETLFEDSFSATDS